MVTFSTFNPWMALLTRLRMPSAMVSLRGTPSFMVTLT